MGDAASVPLLNCAPCSIFEMGATGSARDSLTSGLKLRRDRPLRLRSLVSEGALIFCEQK